MKFLIRNLRSGTIFGMTIQSKPRTMSYVLQMIEEGEHQSQDFKMRVDDARKIARTIVAFANSDGGRLLIGVKDNGGIVGVRAEEEVHVIEMACHNLIFSSLGDKIEPSGFRVLHASVK